MNGQTKVKEFFNYWLTAVVADSVKQNTYICYDGFIRNHIAPAFGDIPLAEIKAETLQSFIHSVKLKPRSIKVLRAVLISAFECAADYELIPKNQCRKVKIPKLNPPTPKAFTREEQVKIETAIRNSATID
jgi:site-specific recombinase XerD